MNQFDIVAIGASAGGLKALSEVLSGLPAELPVPILVVQHLDPRHKSLMAEILQRHCKMKVKEAVHDEAIQKSIVYIWNKDNIITTWNPAAEEMCGVKEEDAVGKNIFSLNIGIGAEEIQQKIRKTVEMRSIYHEGSLEYTAPSGEKKC